MKIKRLVVGGLTLSLLLTGNFTFAKNSSAETVNVSKNFTGWKIENGVNYFYQNGVKFTGQGATRYFVNGRYANQFVTINGVSYFYQNGLKFTGQGATRYFVNGRYANQFITINGVSYFYQNGLKFT
ncbi:MAG: hypothetical protein MRZ16_02820, partial [Parvimonas sp.]|nr:hypothetical protein [Parvimonas sp.]